MSRRRNRTHHSHDSHHAPYAATLALTLLLGGCIARPIEEGHDQPVVEITRSFPLRLEKDVDILFVIDNSLSMQGEQENLGRQLPQADRGAAVTEARRQDPQRSHRRRHHRPWRRRLHLQQPARRAATAGSCRAPRARMVAAAQPALDQLHQRQDQRPLRQRPTDPAGEGRLLLHRPAGGRGLRLRAAAGGRAPRAGSRAEPQPAASCARTLTWRGLDHRRGRLLRGEAAALRRRHQPRARTAGTSFRCIRVRRDV